MRKTQMKKRLTAMGVIFVMLLFIPPEAFPWGFATHAFINDHLAKRGTGSNLNEIYGGVAPDLFNYLFDDPEYLGFLSDETHLEFSKVWEASKYSSEKPLALGFVSHNDVWGADYTAHHACQKCGQPYGYAIAKANLLLSLAPLPPELEIPNDVSLEIFHEIVENAVDILIKRVDLAVGHKLSSAALLRSFRFPILLVRAYAKDFAFFAGMSEPEATQFIKAKESEFRKTIYFYGQILLQDEATAIQLISQQTANLAEGFLALYGIFLPISQEEVVGMVASYMALAIELCQDDYLQEIEATIRDVRHQLWVHDITYGEVPSVLKQPDDFKEGGKR